MMNAAQHLLIWPVRLYQVVLSPLLAQLVGAGFGCRFKPTCSEYTIQAITRKGALAGSWLAIKRLARCHPWGGCGDDPVPLEREHG